MLTKTNRKNFLTKYPNFANASPQRNRYTWPDTYNSYILYVEAKSIAGLCSKLSKELTKLLKLMGYQNLSFLGDTTTPWLFRDHDYKPVKQGLDYLINNKINKGFNGAISVDIDGFAEFIKHLFWLVRCNGVVTDVHFSDDGFNIMASICQYGNLHISTLNEESDATFKEALHKTALAIMPDNKCGGGRIYKRKATYL